MMTREQAAEYALTWEGTPYVRSGRIKGPHGGVDCGTLLAGYLVGIGRVAPTEMETLLDDLGFLSNDWFCNTDSETYLNALTQFASLRWEGICSGKPPAQPGDIALYKVADSKRFNHGSIMLGWPRSLHAFSQRVAVAKPSLHPLTAHTEMAVFDPWGSA
ncbi:MAG: hypothetical protein JST28_09070 [Acidobacteria bacterium]|nr:hypothetical protein [Acidobacteriota bacterium]